MQQGPLVVLMAPILFSGYGWCQFHLSHCLTMTQHFVVHIESGWNSWIGPHFACLHEILLPFLDSYICNVQYVSKTVLPQMDGKLPIDAVTVYLTPLCWKTLLQYCANYKSNNWHLKPQMINPFGNLCLPWICTPGAETFTSWTIVMCSFFSQVTFLSDICHLLASQSHHWTVGMARKTMIHTHQMTVNYSVPKTTGRPLMVVPTGDCGTGHSTDVFAINLEVHFIVANEMAEHLLGIQPNVALDIQWTGESIISWRGTFLVSM